ncbi:MAG TPA: 50S ribosomal protein L15 [Candidatus Paceibacterota bacterium]
MQLHELKRETPNKSEKRVGRGGIRGKTSGRGTKGQKARAGHRIRPAIREQLKKLPKLRGYAQKSIQDKPLAINVGDLDRAFSSGETITAKVLAERGIIRASRSRTLVVKVLAHGELSKKLTISGCSVSAAAKAKIEAAGGTVSEK